MENPFSLKGKTRRQTPNNFTMIKSVTIILVYVSRLKKNLSYFLCSLTRTNYLFQMRQHFALSFLFSSPCTTLSWLSSFSLSCPILAAISSFSFLYDFLFLCPCTHSLSVFSKAAVPCYLLQPVFLPSENLLSLSWYKCSEPLNALLVAFRASWRFICMSNWTWGSVMAWWNSHLWRSISNAIYILAQKKKELTLWLTH